MDSLEKEMAGSERRDNWYVIKGIPVAVLATLGLQTITFVWFLAGLNSKVEVQGEKLTEAISEWKTEMGKVNTKIDALSTSLQNGTVPTALNQRRIEDLERRDTQREAQVNALTLRVTENERKLAGTDARQRAMRDR